MTSRRRDYTALALDAFYLEHRQCGHLETGLTETEPARVADMLVRCAD